MIPFCSASDLEPLIKKLADEDFDVRVRATQELGKYPISYAKIFMKLADGMKDPEVRGRLKQASKLVWHNMILSQDERYRRVYGCIGFWFTEVYVERKMPEGAIPEGPHDYGTHHVLVGLKIDSVAFDTPAVNKLEQFDLLIEVNGKPIADFVKEEHAKLGLFQTGVEYELTLKRLKDVEKIRQRDGQSYDMEKDEFIEFKIKIKATDKEEKYLDFDALSNIEDAAWKEFLDEYEKFGN